MIAPLALVVAMTLDLAGVDGTPRLVAIALAVLTLLAHVFVTTRRRRPPRS